MSAVAADNAWQTYRLRDVVTKLVDGSHNPPPKQDQGRPMLSARNIDQGRINFDEFRYISNDSFNAEHARTRVAPGDVLLTIVGTIGRSAVVPEAAEPFALQRSVAVLSPKDGLLPKFLAYQFQSPQIQRYFEQHARGTAQKGVYLKTLGETPILVPPVTEQHAVVAELEKQFSRLDEAVANLKRVKANLKRYKAAVLKAAVDGRLVPTEAELARREGRGYENAAQPLGRVLEGRRRQAKGRYKEPDTQDTGALPALPEGWVWASAEQCCASVRDGTHDTPAYVTSGIPLVTSKNLLDDGIDFDNTKHISVADHHEISRRSAVARGDVLFAMIGTVGNPTEVKTERPFSIKNVGLFKGDDDCLSAAYLCHWLSSPVLCAWLRPRLKGTTQKFAPLGLLRELPIALPPRSEQDRIVAEVDRRLSIVREVEAEVDANLKRAQALRQAVLARAFFGSNEAVTSSA